MTASPSPAPTPAPAPAPAAAPARAHPLEHRLPPPLVFVAVAAAMWAAARVGPSVALPPVLRVAVVVLLAMAALVGPLGIREFRRARTTIDPVRIGNASELVTTGVFARTRNPMYLSMALLLTAWAVWLQALVPVIGPVVFVAFIQRFQIVPEERAMAARFGAAYDTYRARVRRWI